MASRVLAQEWVTLDGFASGPTDESEIFAAVAPSVDAVSMDHDRTGVLPMVSEILLGRRSTSPSSGSGRPPHSR